ncbi:MAG: hypothetical protein K2K80_01270 [Clostridia bacterium]|nr:hypothetical protein [Clostridia bacterium]
MEMPYILTIVVCSLFVLLFIIYVIVYVRKKNAQRRRMHEIEQMYADKNLAQMDYDSAVYDEETEKLLAMHQQDEGQISVDDTVKHAVAAAADETVFQKVDMEGVEEITGNYNPNK